MCKTASMCKTVQQYNGKTDDDWRKSGKKVRLNNHSDAPLGKAVNHKAVLHRNNTQTWKKKNVLVFCKKNMFEND